MTTSIRKHFPFVLLALVFVATSPHFLAQDVDDDETIPLQKIIANPDAFLDIPVSFVIQFHRLEKADNPVFTRFLKQWDMNFSAWADGERLWTKEGFKNDFSYFFVRRGSEGHQTLLKAPIFSRWVVTGIVTRVFKGKPWIQVEGLARLEDQLDMRTLGTLARGFRMMTKSEHMAAADAFASAQHEGLPAGVRSMAYKQQALALFKAGKPEEGIDALRAARSELPDDPTLDMALQTYRSQLAAMRESHPAQEAEAPASDQEVAAASQEADADQAESPAATENETPPARSEEAMTLEAADANTTTEHPAEAASETAGTAVEPQAEPAMPEAETTAPDAEPMVAEEPVPAAPEDSEAAPGNLEAAPKDSEAAPLEVTLEKPAPAADPEPSPAEDVPTEAPVEAITLEATLTTAPEPEPAPTSPEPSALKAEPKAEETAQPAPHQTETPEPELAQVKPAQVERKPEPPAPEAATMEAGLRPSSTAADTASNKPKERPLEKVTLEMVPADLLPKTMGKTSRKTSAN